MRFLSGTLCAVLLLTAGCGGPVTQEDLDLARESVQAALDAWKQGATIDSLKGRPTPIEFNDDDWQRGAKLIDYQMGKVYGPKDGSPRCSVILTVQPRNGKPVQKEITYQVNVRPKLVIARDPYS